MINEFTRRKFLKIGVLTGAGTYLYLGCEGSLLAQTRARSLLRALDLEASSPIAMLSGAFGSTSFNGDDYNRAHEAIWDVEGYIRSKGGRPATIWAEAPVAVVGGGISGLMSAYFLRDLSPVLLEQAPRFGGNAKGETFNGTSFGLGAAYVDIPKSGDEIDQFFKDLNISGLLRSEDPSAIEVEMKGAGLKKFWRGESDPSARESFLAVERELTRINQEEFPDIPWTSASAVSLARFREWDQQSAESWLKNTFSGLHPHVAEYFQLYCWSSFGGSSSEISAAQFLNFVAAETDGTATFPGGNSMICEALFRRLANSKASLYPSSFVLEVKNVDGGVEVLFEDASGVLRRLKVDTAVVAAPKYVARYIVKDLPAQQSQLWQNLNYRAYVVINVLLAKKQQKSSYDVYFLEGQVPPTPAFQSPPSRPWADIVSGDWALNKSDSASVLTIYRPYPYDGARNILFGDAEFARIKADVARDLPLYLEDLGLSANDLIDVRLTRWGHAIPLASPGLASDGSLDILRAAVGRVFFANQDCFMNPAFESCFASVQEVTKQIRTKMSLFESESTEA